MFSGTNNLSQYNTRNVIIWMTLAFQAGAVNVGGFLACHRFVTHTTGFATHFGAEMALGNYMSAFSLATVPLFFLAGAMFSAYMVDYPANHPNPHRYDYALGAIGACMLLVVIGGTQGSFGKFGEAYEYNLNFLLLVFLSTAMGIQNAVISSASSSSIRTTHLTGITTDLGIGIMRVFSDQVPESVRRHELKATGMRLGIIGFFILGSGLCAFVFLRFEYWGFIIPTITSFGILIIAKLTRHGFGHRRGHGTRHD